MLFEPAPQPSSFVKVVCYDFHLVLKGGQETLSYHIGFKVSAIEIHQDAGYELLVTVLRPSSFPTGLPLVKDHLSILVMFQSREKSHNRA